MYLPYYAHTSPNKTETDADVQNWQTLEDHLNNVATLAGDYAQAFNAKDWAYLAGLLHDLGKYSESFQRRLRGENIRTDHATAGAKMVIEHLTKVNPKFAPLGKLLSFAIAGHHAGLANGVHEGENRSTLEQRLKAKISVIDDVWKTEISLPNQLRIPPLKPNQKYSQFGLAFFTRMVFSCLIDADRTDTNNYVQHIKNKPIHKAEYPSIEVLQKQFENYLSQLNPMDSNVNTLRNNVLEYANQQTHQPSGLFTLTVPTGGGKTFTSLSFALKHAVHHQKRRIIYVIPFTSIIEQTANVFRNALGEYANAVLEHHSAFDREKLPKELQGVITKADYQDKLRIAMESWDAPLVVTTAVQFFESLFADRPSQCRKLHNIANSVIILDEAQTLNLKLLRPIMAAIEELALNYGCSIVLCTATQPALLKENGFHNGFENVREIAPNPRELFNQLRRVQVKNLGEQTDNQLIENLKNEKQVLMIVNNRRHARTLFESIKEKDGAYHLTTSMCAAHRSFQLEIIRDRLKNGEPCRLVATSLIEAGVDVDFPVVYRAEAGLDSIAQAAGRCNREGKRKIEESSVFIFQSAEKDENDKPQWKTPTELSQLAAPMRSIVRNHADVLSPEAIQKYFEAVYWTKGSELDSKQILKMHSDTKNMDFPFQNVAKAFQMIESFQLPIIIAWNEDAKQAIEALRHAEHIGGIARQLQRFIVQVSPKDFAYFLQHGDIKPIVPERFGNQFYELVEKKFWYSETAGLDLREDRNLPTEALVC